MKTQIKNALPAIQNITPLGEGDALTRYKREVQKFPILSASEEYEYAIRWRNDHDMRAAEHLLASHLRQVVKIAYDYENYGIPMTELIASGNLGLMQALHKFEPEKGFRFSTYAQCWIRAEIYETILNSWSIVKIGTSANQKHVFFKLKSAQRALGIMDGKMSDEQMHAVAKYLDVSDRDVIRMSQRMAARDLSLNAPIHSDDGAGTDILSNMTDNSDTIADVVEAEQMRRHGYELLQRHLANLKERDREILVARRLSDPAVTLEALSKKYGISRERVRQIEERAYANLRDAILAEAGENK